MKTPFSQSNTGDLLSKICSSKENVVLGPHDEQKTLNQRSLRRDELVRRFKTVKAFQIYILQDLF